MKPALPLGALAFVVLLVGVASVASAIAHSGTALVRATYKAQIDLNVPLGDSVGWSWKSQSPLEFSLLGPTGESLRHSEENFSGGDSILSARNGTYSLAWHNRGFQDVLVRFDMAGAYRCMGSIPSGLCTFVRIELPEHRSLTPELPFWLVAAILSIAAGAVRFRRGEP